MQNITGKAIKIGDHVDTDAIIPARYCTSIDRQVLGAHLLEGWDPQLRAKLDPGLILVAGRNFGCGSAREHAPLAIAGAGLPVVIAQTFSRTFFRNAINIALPVIELPEAEKIQDGDIIEIRFDEGIVFNQTSGVRYQVEPYPEIIRQILNSGGLLEFAKRKLKQKSP